MPTLIFSNTPRDTLRPILIAKDEFYCSIEPPTIPTCEAQNPKGPFDAAEWIAKLPEPWCKPTLAVFFCDTLYRSEPRNLAEIRCPKVLLVGDVHHGEGWLSSALKIATDEPFDLIASWYTRQHLHFFRELGLNSAWLPAFLAWPLENHSPTPWEKRRYDCSFVGQAGKLHPYRYFALTQLVRGGSPVRAMEGNQIDAGLCHADSRLSLNISLNGDFNMRIIEVLASGSMLLTDRLSPESGLELLFENRRDLVLFDDVKELAGQIDYYLKHPEEAQKIAAAGQQAYFNGQRPSQKIDLLHDMVKRGPSGPYDPSDDRRCALESQDRAAVLQRAVVYELLQRMHRLMVRVHVHFWHTAQRFAADAIDLPRLRVSVLRSPDGGESGALSDAGLGNRVTWCDRQDIEPMPANGANILVVPRASLGEEALHQLLRENRCDLLICAQSEDQLPPELEAKFAEFHPIRDLEKPLCLAFPRPVRSPLPPSPAAAAP